MPSTADATLRELAGRGLTSNDVRRQRRSTYRSLFAGLQICGGALLGASLAFPWFRFSYAGESGITNVFAGARFGIPIASIDLLFVVLSTLSIVRPRVRARVLSAASAGLTVLVTMVGLVGADIRPAFGSMCLFCPQGSPNGYYAHTGAMWLAIGGALLIGLAALSFASDMGPPSGWLCQ